MGGWALTPHRCIKYNKAIEGVIFIVEEIILKKYLKSSFLVAPTPQGNDPL
jgi:hypothetical protein